MKSYSQALHFKADGKDHGVCVARGYLPTSETWLKGVKALDFNEYAIIQLPDGGLITVFAERPIYEPKSSPIELLRSSPINKNRLKISHTIVPGDHVRLAIVEEVTPFESDMLNVPADDPYIDVPHEMAIWLPSAWIYDMEWTPVELGTRWSLMGGHGYSIQVNGSDGRAYHVHDGWNSYDLHPSVIRTRFEPDQTPAVYEQGYSLEHIYRSAGVVCQLVKDGDQDWLKVTPFHTEESLDIERGSGRYKKVNSLQVRGSGDDKK